jgi:hypothetical protein
MEGHVDWVSAFGRDHGFYSAMISQVAYEHVRLVEIIYLVREE